MCMNSHSAILLLSPLHTLQKGDLNAVKVLVAFGASVNATSNRGQTPFDLATVGYLNQERKLSLSNTALNRHLVTQNSRKSSLRLPHQSILLKTTERVHCFLELFQIDQNLVDMDVDGDLDGWTCVDFTDVPPV